MFNFQIKNTWITQYGLSIFLVLLATVGYEILKLYIPTQIPLFIWFYPAVILSALFGGLGPGILSTILSTFIVYYFMLLPYNTFQLTNKTDIVLLTIFFTMGIFISVLVKIFRTKKELILQQQINKQQQLALDISNLGDFNFDLINNKSNWSKKLDEIFNFAPGEFNGNYKEFESKIYPEDLFKFNTELERSKKHKDRYLCEYRIIWKDGSIHWVSCTGEFIYDSKGKEIYMYGVIGDITERKLLDETIHLHSTSYNRSLIESSLDPLLTIDPKGKILDVNQITAEIFGVDKQTLMGSNFYNYCVNPEKVHNDYEQVFKEGLIRDYSIIIINQKTKQPITILCNTTRYIDEENKMSSVIIAAKDITKLTLVEQQLADNIELKRANEELENFSYSVSHDLRAPLRAIDGFISLLLDKYTKDLDVEGQRLFKIVANNAKKMGELIDDILHFSRSGKMIRRSITINMTELVQHVWDDLIITEKNRDIIFKLNELPNTLGDSIMLHEVIQNLLDNALKFTNKNKQTIIEINGYIKNDEIIYSIKDNGVGFNMKYLPKLFGLFQRLHSTSEFQGTGVGLAIIKQLISKHNGRVWAEGEVNNGATFYFALPITVKE